MSDDDSGDVQLAEAAGSADTKPSKPDTAISLCRVAVLIGKTQTDVVLPTDVPIGSLIFDAIR